MSAEALVAAQAGALAIVETVDVPVNVLVTVAEQGPAGPKSDASDIGALLPFAPLTVGGVTKTVGEHFEAFSPNLNLRGVDVESEFSMPANGSTDATLAFLALAAHAAGNPKAFYRGRRGSSYLLDSASSLQLPDGLRLDLSGARIRRTLPLDGTNNLLRFGVDTRIDRLIIDMAEAATFRRLVRFTNGCRVGEIRLTSPARIQNKASDLDAAIQWVGDNSASMREAGADLVVVENIDAAMIAVQFSLDANTPNAARDFKFGSLRFRNVGLGLYLRNVSDISIDDLASRGSPTGSLPAADGFNHLLLNGAQRLTIKSLLSEDSMTHSMRLAGPVANTFEQINADIQIGTYTSVRCRRCGFKVQPAADSNRLRGLSVGTITVIDAGYDAGAVGSTYVPPESNEEGVRLDNVDNATIGSIQVFNRERPYSGYDGLTIANCTNITVGSLTSSNPLRRHLCFLNYTQGGLPSGPLKDITVATVKGIGAGAENIAVECVGFEFSGVSVPSFDFVGGTDVVKIDADIQVRPSAFSGRATGFSGLPFNLASSGGPWRSASFLRITSPDVGAVFGAMLNTQAATADGSRGAGPFSADGLTLKHFRLANGTGATNAISRVTGVTADTALSWDRSVAGTTASFLEQRLERVRNYGDKWVTLLFTASRPVGAGSADLVCYLSQNFGSGGSASVNTASTTVTITETAQQFAIPFYLPSVLGKTVGANNRLAVLFQRFSGASGGIILFENFDLVVAPFASKYQPRTTGMDNLLATSVVEL